MFLTSLPARRIVCSYVISSLEVRKYVGTIISDTSKADKDVKFAYLLPIQELRLNLK